MKMRRLILSVLIFLLPNVLFAQAGRKGSMKKPFVLSQQFKHAAGPGAGFYVVGKTFEPIYELAYNPTLSLTRSWSDFSISIGSQLAGGYHIESDVDSLSFFFADLPLTAEINIGHNASKDFYSDFGFFFGGGYAYHLFREEWNSGFVATGGIRFFLFGPSMTLRYSRFFASQEPDASIHNISLLLNLGRYFEQVKLNNKVSRFSNGR
jgi:hypothetical protein